MSNSVFTDFTAQTKNDSSLVIVMNKDGSVVSVDPTALRSYLKNESGNTSVSVVRVTSPTPSLKEEIEKEQQEKPLDNDDMDIESTRQDVDEEAPHVRVTVEDFYPPDEAKKLAAEILQYAGMTSHLLLDIDNEERVKSIHNDHCYTPLTSPSQRHPASRSQTPTAAHQTAPKEPKKVPEIKQKDDSKAKEESPEAEKSEAETESTESESEFSVSESENDRDSDLDYQVNDRVSRRVSGRKVRGGVAKGVQSTRNRVGRKRQSFSVEGGAGESGEEEVIKEKKKKPKGKISNKASPVKVVKKKEEVQVIQQQVVKEEVKGIPEVSAGGRAGQQLQPVKKDKKPPAHVEALFSDMTSLFSTPDIIKKVGSEAGSGAGSKTEPPPLVYTKTFGQKKESALETDRDQLELIDSIVKQEMETSQTMSGQRMAEDIPSIVKMLENPESSIDPVLLNDVIGLNSNQVPTTSAPSVQTSGQTDLDLLEGLASEDGLPDELLQHVAELVENKNLQEVIDKQVLGVQTTLSTSTVTTISTNPPVSSSTPKTEEKESPFVKLAKQKQMAKEAAASIMSMNRKEPITIVRSDGRVITLPPIEAPTTRGAKRRAQSSASTPNTSVASSPTSTPQQKSKDPDSLPSMKKIVSKMEKEGKAGSRRTSATPSVAESEENMDSDASWNSEDDPDRLWCICKQPHNNRFMICCDSCEDWFHGKCVNITKAMGQQMEEQGIEWRCPNCLKKGGSAKKSGDSEGSSTLSPSSSSSSGLLSCIVCKKPARLNSIYCSDDCIRKHAMVTTKISAKEPPAKPAGPPGTKKVGVLKNKFDRVIVYNKVTGKCLSGESAPTLTNLKHWLSENPNYEVVQPGSALGQAFKAKQAQLASISKQMAIKRQQQAERESAGRDKVQTQLKVTQKGQIVVMHSSGQKVGGGGGGVGEGKAVSKPTKLPQASTSGQKTTLKQSTLPVTKVKKSPVSGGGGDSSKPVARGEPEPIRVNVRRTLKEQLTSRIADTPEAVGKLSVEEVTKFATDVEYEMFILFNKDTGTKYRAKYRSLMFNIKDRKNMSLLEKICGKMITAGQLVRMAPEELASQELAQWRENENKHQLEMIKKSELDLLACAKNYVLKTHKGEEVIESRISDRVSLDPSIAVEDVVSVLNDTVTSSSEPGGGTGSGKEKSQGKGDKGKDGVSSSKSHFSSSSKKRDRDRRSRSRDRHDSRGKSSKHKRKRSRDRRSRSREKEERHRESKRDDRKDKGGRERDRKSVSSSSSKKSSEVKPSPKELKPLVSEKKEDTTFNLIDKILKASEMIENPPQLTEEDKKEESKEIKEEPMEKTEILSEPPKKSMSVESDQEPSSTITIPTPPETAFDTEEEFPEDKPSIWSGSINMVDVATFQIAAFGVSGDCEVVGKELPAALDIVGRISPETVWEYISKIKKSGNKEILIVQFKAEMESEQAKYSALYSYLDSRKRLGVVKTSSTTIKDFYISPLAAHKSLPTVLLPIKGVGFEDNRPDLLLGIIVMIRSGIKRVATTQVSSKHAKRAALAAAKAQIPATDNHTPPTSPNPSVVIKPKGGLQESRKKLMMILPKQSVKDKAQVPDTKATVPAKEPNPDDDEPCSPGGSDEDIPIIPSSTSAAPATISALDADDIQRKMEELNRQIGAKKMEIAGILNKGQDTVNDEPYSPSRPVTPPGIPAIPAAIPSLANISIPSNLSEILASIKSVSGPAVPPGPAAPLAAGAKGTNQVTPMEVDDDEEYTPIAPSSSSVAFQGVDYKPAGYKPVAAAVAAESSGPSKLAQLSEEELLSMVPDDAILEDIKATKSEEAAEKEREEPLSKKSKWDEKDKSSEPPPPGLEDEYEPE